MLPRDTTAVNPSATTSFRCIGCYGWTDRPHAIGVFIPSGDTFPLGSVPPITYPLCEKCKKAIQRGGKRVDRITQNAESYIVGLAKELAGVGE